jgi:hypothetical protein
MDYRGIGRYVLNMNLEVRAIQSKQTYSFILNIHYAKRIPSISFAYGLYEGCKLIGICTFGQPASPSLCIGIMGVEYKSKVLELNRLCLLYNRKNEASYFVGKCLNLLPKPRVVVSYADSAQNHLGTVYQACNFLFTGTTKPRTDMASVDGKHSRHHSGDRTNRVYRSAKHRYVYLVGSKTDKKVMKRLLKYPVIDYPKMEETDENKN